MSFSIDQSIQVRVDYDDLFELGACEIFEDDRTDTARSNDAEMGAACEAYLLSMPQLSTVRTKMTARVGWMRFRSAIGSGMLRSDSPNLRVVGRSGPISCQKRAPDTVGIHGQAKQRQVCLSNEGRDDVALSIVIYVTQCLPAGSGMAVKDGDACL